MNQNIKMILFVIILGSITSFLLIGMDMLTSDRIALNKEAQVKSIILDAYDINFNYTNIHDVFDEKVNKIEVPVIYNEGLANEYTTTYIFYQDQTTGAISYQFSGDGVWGLITGMITLESDFETIKDIAIISQVETPGLGGVVAEEDYLETFIGKSFIDSEIIILKKDSTPNAENEVDAISGATRTSSAFNIILNDSYDLYKDVWENR